jgi:hypothetical protein
LFYIPKDFYTLKLHFEKVFCYENFTQQLALDFSLHFIAVYFISAS